MTYKVTLYLDPVASTEIATDKEKVEETISDLVTDEFTIIVRGADDTAEVIRSLYRWLDDEDCILTNLPDLIFNIGIELLSKDDSSISYIDCIAEIERV